MEMQRSFGSLEFAGKKKVTKREMFRKGERGRPPMGIEKMLRIYFLRQWYGLADEAGGQGVRPDGRRTGDQQGNRGAAGLLRRIPFLADFQVGRRPDPGAISEQDAPVGPQTLTL